MEAGRPSPRLDPSAQHLGLARLLERHSSAGAVAPAWAGPLRYDDSGFPIRQSLPRFSERVKRRLAD